ncbi:MAG: endonuclease [Chitinophagaceae bacterium]|nr:endonuclease [Chitinophagaceae bacterium]
MPEGPSIVILKEAVKAFEKKKVISIGGNTKIDVKPLEGKKIIAFKSWGKHFLICFKDATLCIHFLLFGSYRINEKKDSPPRLQLGFAKGELNFYACSVQFLEGNPDNVYDWSGDVMNDKWDARKAKAKLKAQPSTLVCDALLDQNIFAGVGNIIKNEVLYRIKVHPKSKVGKLPPAKLTALVNEARNYSFDFLEWKKAYVLRKHWLAHTKKTCPRCDLPIKKEYMGKTGRRTFFCKNCQVRF